MTDRLRVAVVHYHVRRGGVTRVIERAAEALAGRTELVVFCGEAPSEPLSNLRVEVVEGLAYNNLPPSDPDGLSRALDRAAEQALGGVPDLWHFHNHSLGKNLAVPRLVQRWAAEGRRLLLQIHDFAEDGRPANYRLLREGLGDDLDDGLYPRQTGVHYAMLTGRDRRIMAGAGLDPGRVHLLPNPVVLGDAPTRPPPPDGPMLYPTRAIRRKNIGELLLWSVVHREARFGVTLAPQNPAARPVYDRWVQTAGDLDLPVAFDLGARASFEALLASARALVTTSINEGFGLAFLEPWLAGRPLVGRDLPDITADFKAEGLRLDRLYDRLLVPRAWVEEARLAERVKQGLIRSYEAYGEPLPSDAVNRAMSAAGEGDAVDVGRLDEEFQEAVLRHLIREPDAGGLIKPPVLGLGSTEPDLIRENRDILLACYNTRQYGERLMTLYETVLSDGPGASPDEPGVSPAGNLLNTFLAPERFHLLKS